MRWIDFFEQCGFQIVWGHKSFVLVPRCHIQILLNSFGVWPLHFSPEDFKNRMGIAKNFQNENTRPINSVDLVYMQ
jgi:hypothetical protein